MNWLKKLFGGEKTEQPTISLRTEDEGVEFYKYNKAAIPKETAYCSDRECPCDETPIPRGSGYLYISEEAVSFMEAKLKGRVPDNVLFMGAMPILICEQGAKLRGIDLEVAAADARRWWKTGKVPLRSTPSVNVTKSASGIVYVIILKSPPEPPNAQWYISQVLAALCPEVKGMTGIPIKFQVTDQYADEYYIGTVARLMPLQDGIEIDLGKMRFRHFEDADGGNGTLIQCYE